MPVDALPPLSRAAQVADRASTLRLAGLTCAGCGAAIEAALAGVPGVAWTRVNAATRLARVGFDPARTDEPGLVAAVRRAGYDAAPDTPQAAAELRRREQRATLWNLFVASFCAMQVMMMASPSYVAAPGELSPDMRALLNWGSWVLSLPVMGFSGAPYLRAAARSLRARSLGMEVPVALGLLVTFVASTLATFDPAGPLGHEVYFDSLTMFLAFLWLGRWLEMRARHASAGHLEAAIDGLPSDVLRVGPGTALETVALMAVRPGERLRVRPGDTVPVDGTLADERAQLSEALLTGESQAVTRRRDEPVLAGTVNEGPVFDLVVTRTGVDTRLHSVVDLMHDALSTRPASARMADRWAGPFLAGVLLLSAGAAAVWSVVDPSRAIWVAVSVLIVTCPCALSLAAPATLVAAAGGLARRGLLVRRLDALERLVVVQGIVFDKTGTLTHDRPRAQLLHAVDPQADVARAAGLARLSSHPVCAAIAELDPDHATRAAGAGSEGGAAWIEVWEEPGSGMAGRDERGRLWRLGSAQWTGTADAADAEARVWLVCEGEQRARFALQEALRPQARSTVAALRAAGLSCTLLTGDTPARARAVASSVGIDDVVALASPERKLQVLQARRAGSRPEAGCLPGPARALAAVGDGINDAPLLAAADVSFALGHGALAAREGADAVITGESLTAIVDAVSTAHRARSIVRQNLAWAAAYNAACIPLALAGWLPPWAAGLGMAGSSLLVILHARRAAHPALDRAGPLPGRATDCGTPETEPCPGRT